MLSSRTRLVLLLGVVAFLVVGGAVLVLSRHGERETGGPVRVVEGNSLSTSAPVGKRFMFGVPVVYNHGGDRAELETARFVKPTAGLQVVATYVAGSKRGAEFEGSSREWPVRTLKDLSPLGGFEIAPQSRAAGKRGAELVFVLQVARPGRYTTRGAELDYKVGDKKYRRTVPSSLAVCAADQPAAKLVKLDCKFPPKAEGEL